MSEHEQPLTPEERHAREALGSVAPPRADAAFRARLKQEFATGAISPRRGAVLRGPWYARPAAWLPLAAAAAVAIVLSGLNRGPDWQVVSARGEGFVIVGERPVPLGHAAELAGLLRRGGRVRVPEGASLDLVVPGDIAVSLASGTDATLPAAPNRWWGRGARARVATGDAFFATGRAFHGATLDVETSELRAHVVGTTFAVLRHPEGSCVCVMEGRVQIVDLSEDEDETVEIPAGMRRICPVSGPDQTLPILDDSAHELHRLREQSARLLEH